jgi:hypothetical protein
MPHTFSFSYLNQSTKVTFYSVDNVRRFIYQIFEGFGTETTPSEIATTRIMSDQRIAGFTIFGGTSED